MNIYMYFLKLMHVCVSGVPKIPSKFSKFLRRLTGLSMWLSSVTETGYKANSAVGRGG